MNEPVAKPSLLTITAPAPRREPEPAEGFDDSLADAAATALVEPPRSLEKPEETADESADRPADERVEAAADSDDLTSDESKAVEATEESDLEEAPDFAGEDAEGTQDTLPAVVALDVDSLSVATDAGADDAISESGSQFAVLEEAPENPETPVPLPETTLTADSTTGDGSTAEGDPGGAQDPNRPPQGQTPVAAPESEVPSGDLAASEEVGSTPVEDSGDSSQQVAASEVSSAAGTGAAEVVGSEAGKRIALEGLSSDATAEVVTHKQISPETVAPPQTTSSVSPTLEPIAPDATALNSGAATVESNAETLSVQTTEGSGPREAGRLENQQAASRTEPRTQSVDAARFVARVSGAFEAAQDRGGGPIRIRLSPPELGQLQVRLEVKDGVMTASLETETHAARNLLLDNLPALRERLAEQQIRVEQFDVDVRDEGRSQAEDRGPDARADREETGDDPPEQPSEQKPSSTVSPAESPLPSPTITFANDRVDLVA